MKKILVLVTMFCTFLPATSAHGYLLAGKVWSSTSSPKSPVAHTASIPTSYLGKINNSLGDWHLLPSSALKTGTVTHTSSITTYENAAFQITRQSVFAITGHDDPAVTITFPNTNHATVFLSNRWSWSTDFDQSQNVGHLRTVLTHEFGHVWGIVHPNADSGSMTAVERNSVMNPNFTVKYAPNSDDIAAMASMY